MNDCSWCLLLDGCKVRNIRQLREHFDTAALVGYLRGGSLTRWLAEVGEFEILSRIAAISADEDAGTALQYIFGVSPDIKYEPQPYTEGSAEEFPFAGFMGCFNGSFNSSFNSSFSSSFSGGVFEYAGSFTTSFSVLLSGSYVNLLSAGGTTSFSVTSFTRGSFGAGVGVGVGVGTGGSFGSFGSFGIRGVFGKSGSFYYTAGGVEITEHEYKRTMINLSSCPLNEYGYGIHRI